MKFTTAAIASTAAGLVVASPCKPSYAASSTAAASTTASAPAPSNTGSSGSNPWASPIFKDGEVFRVFANGEGSDLNDASIQALNRGLRIGAAQGATCTNSEGSSYSVNYASFQLQNGTLTLTTGDNPAQIFFTDRSGMGQGVVQYTSGPANGRNFETQGFTVNKDSNLVWRDTIGTETGFQACPIKGTNGEYAVWLNSTPNPAGYEGCKPFTARAQKEPENNLIACKYTE